MSTPDLAERIAASLFRNELEQEESLEPSEVARIIRAELAEAKELREVREAMRKQEAWLIALANQSDRLADRDVRFQSLVEAHRADAKNYRATAKHMTTALAALDRIAPRTL